MFNKPRLSRHIERIKRAKSKVSTQSPLLDMRRILDVGKLNQYVEDHTRTKKINHELLMKLNAIDRLGGRVDTFEGCEVASYVQSRIPILIQQYRDWDKENIIIGNRLLHRGAEVECWMDERNLRQPPPKAVEKFTVPFDILSKYSQLNLPDDSLIKKLMRPLVFFDFYIKDVRPLGRVIINLYTEACPQVVLALVRACRFRQANNMAVKRIFPSLWMDFELKLSADDQINVDKIEYDKRALDHSHPGVLHFSRQMQQQLPSGVFVFSISAKPLPMLNGKRVAFGRVTHGLRVIECMQSVGMKKCGKLKRRIGISKMGVLT